ncbi:Choline O-acetyltransferase [Eumeta japonica]|uniref:Choline O-acetyltransferase n=1 Tax=Eumeta variegata TaxID=151549 RepID=A0A4C1YJD8_EUMVA|nr:Choline O-acetyltransferase [Eumeta japonica]
MLQMLLASHRQLYRGIYIPLGINLIISSDGTVGMCYEHSAAEGVAVVRLAERALARAEVAPRPAPPPALLPAPVPMRWALTDDMKRTIDQAAADLDRQIADLDCEVFTYRGYGREFMKACRASPDAYIQLAMQYAYYKCVSPSVCTILSSVVEGLPRNMTAFPPPPTDRAPPATPSGSSVRLADGRPMPRLMVAIRGFFFPNAKAYRLRLEAYYKAALSERTSRECFQKFKKEDFDVEDKIAVEGQKFMRM